MTLDGLYAYAEENGISVVSFPLGDLEAMSLITSDGRPCIGIDPDRLSSKQDEKIKLSHELGHVVQNAFYNSFAACDVWERQENKANRWSFRSLVSEKDLRKAVKNGLTEVWELAEYFDVPPEVMAKICHYYKYGNMNFPS